MNNRKITITKKPNKAKSNKQNRQMVELDIVTHAKLREIAFKANRPLREIVDMLLNDALQYVEIREDEKGGQK